MRGAGWLAALFTWLVPLCASAHPLVDEARRYFEQAELERALEVLDRAERADDLTPEDAGTLYETRALVYSALQQTSAVQRDLRRLAIVAPERELGPSAPPELREFYARLRQEGVSAPEIHAEAALVDGRVVIRGVAGEDPLGLLRSLRLGGRSAGAPAFALLDAGQLTLEPPTISPAAYYAQAIGPGGVVLASDGSPTDPLLFSFQLSDGGLGGGDELLLWVLIGAGAAVVVTAIVIGAVAASAGPSDLTQPILPELTP